MGQDLILVFFLIIIAYVINEIRKFYKYESKPIQHAKLPANSVHAKTAPVKSQEIAIVNGKKEDSLLSKNSTSCSRKILNRSSLRQSILISEILARKY